MDLLVPGPAVDLSLIEAALEAWAECEPEGYLLPERRVLALLLTLGAHLPGGEQGSLGARARRLEALVPLPGGGGSGGGSGAGAFDLAAKHGKVHLLYFWRAYGEVARLVACPSHVDAEAAAPAAAPAQSCVAELERLRDTALAQLEASSGKTITARALAEVLRHIAETSAVQAFWKQVAESMKPDSKAREFGMEELTVLLLSWLHDAVMWQEAPGRTLQTGMLPAFGLDGDAESCSLMMTSASLEPLLGPHMSASARTSLAKASSRPPSQLQMARPMASSALMLDLEEQCRASGALASPPTSILEATQLPAAASELPSPIRPPEQAAPEIVETPPGVPEPLRVANMRTAIVSLDTTLRLDDTADADLWPGLPVDLHIYDVSQEASIQRLNAFLANRMSPIKLGGIFHAAVEVDGVEWSYGRTECQSSTGVTRTQPRADPNHHFRETVPLQPTALSKEEVGELVAQLKHEYLGRDYDLLRRNCCHFADDLCQRLGVGRIPAWVYRLARIGSRIDRVLRPMHGLRGSVSSASVPSQSPSQSPSHSSSQPAAAAKARREERASLLT